MLVVYRDRLAAVNALYFADYIVVNGVKPVDSGYIGGAHIALRDCLTAFDVVALGDDKAYTVGALIGRGLAGIGVGYRNRASALDLGDCDVAGQLGYYRGALRTARLEQLLNCGRPCVYYRTGNTPVWKVRIVSCVPGSPMDCAR